MPRGRLDAQNLLRPGGDACPAAGQGMLGGGGDTYWCGDTVQELHLLTVLQAPAATVTPSPTVIPSPTSTPGSTITPAGAGSAQLRVLRLSARTRVGPGNAGILLAGAAGLAGLSAAAAAGLWLRMDHGSAR